MYTTVTNYIHLLLKYLAIQVQHIMEPVALRILDITQTGVSLDTGAFNSVLDKVGDKPLVIYSISGATRSGKSYLLNFFVKYFEAQKQNQQQSFDTINSGPDQNWISFVLTSNFAWRSGKERETTGMNLWSEPYFVQTETGPVAVLLIDTQGLFDDKTTARQNAIIFSLTTLCSSVTIFNVSRQIDEALLQQIQYFSSYAQMSSAESIDTEPPAAASNSTLKANGTFQNLLLLVRDFETPGYVHGFHGRIKEPKDSRNNFMRDTFHLESRPFDCPEENTMVRQAILQKYDDVSVCLLPDPGKGFIREGSTPDYDFLQHLTSFIEHMLSPEHLVKKTVHGRVCTGLEFKLFINHWAKLVDKSTETFPEVYTMAENTAFMQYTIAKEMAFTYFFQKMEGLLFSYENGSRVSHSDLKKDQKFHKENALRIYRRMKKFQNPKFENKFQNELEDAIQEYLETSAQMQPLRDLDEANKRSKNQSAIISMNDDSQNIAGGVRYPSATPGRSVGRRRENLVVAQSRNQDENVFYECLQCMRDCFLWLCSCCPCCSTKKFSEYEEVSQV